jgi:hypothetical protein
MAAVFLENTVRSSIQDCVFERNDGIAVMFSGYNRLALVTGSEFVWNGETAIAGATFHDTAARRTTSFRFVAPLATAPGFVL